MENNGIFMELETKGVTLDKVLLNEENTERIEKFLEEYKNGKKLRETKNNLKPINAIFFIGQPGTGKTYLAKALSNELNIKLLTLDIGQAISGTKTLENINQAFDEAERIQDCILFLDECDSIVPSREKKGVSENIHQATNLVMQRLNELNEKVNDKTVVICATNMIDQIDEAFITRFQMIMDFEMGKEILPYIRDLVKLRKKRFRLIEDADEKYLRGIDNIRNNNKKKYVSVRQLQFVINMVYKQRVIEEDDSQEIIDIYLTDILREITKVMKFPFSDGIPSKDKIKQKIDAERQRKLEAKRKSKENN